MANAHILALRDLHNGSRKCNLGNGRGYSIQQVIETARKITGHSIPAETRVAPATWLSSLPAAKPSTTI